MQYIAYKLNQTPTKFSLHITVIFGLSSVIMNNNQSSNQLADNQLTNKLCVLEW